MADNETTVSVGAEVTLDASQVATGLEKVNKALSSTTKHVHELATQIDNLGKSMENMAKVAGKSFSQMSKSDMKEAKGLLAKAEQVRANGQYSKQPRKASRQSKLNRPRPDTQSTLAEDAKAKQIEIQAKNADSRAKAVDLKEREFERKKEREANRNQRFQDEKPLRDAELEVKKNRSLLLKAQAGRITDEFRYKPGVAGGIASGIGGAISRARARSGLAGFAARVGTGVGQLFPQANIMKGSTMSGLGLNALTLAFSAAGTAVSKLTSEVGKLAVESLQAYGEVESLKTSLSVVYGSDTEANAAFEGIKEYSLQSPFGVEQTTEMAILLKQSGIYGTELMDTMKMIGDTAGGNAEKFQRIANNYAQIASIGKASMLDMRQFAYAGIPIYKKVAEELGVSQSILRQMISDGEVTNEVIEKVFKTMTSEGGEFYKAVDRGAQTLNARIVNLKDSFNLAKSGIGEMLFKADVLGTGSRIDDQGTFGGILNALEELVRKADDWARLKNIERDMSNISSRRESVEGLDAMIAEMTAKGKDASALRGLRTDITGVATPDTELAIQYEANLIAREKLDKGSSENITRIKDEIRQLNDALKFASDKNVKKAITDRINQLNDDLDDVRKYAPLVQSDFRVSTPGKGPAASYRLQPGEQYERFSEMAMQTTPARYQVEASRLASTLLEQGQKRAGSASSLGVWADRTVQDWKGTEAGKAEAERKRKEEYDRNYAEFTRLSAMIGDTGRLLEGVDVDIGKFVALMKSGIITPLEEVSLAFHDIARHKDDTSPEIMAKRKQWIGLQERAGDVEGLIPTLPPELSDGLKRVVSVLEKEGLNSEANVNELNTALVRLSEMQGFAENDAARLITQYLLTSSASVAREVKPYAGESGKGGEESIPLWKRITGSATGIDPMFIHKSVGGAADFYDTYTKGFQNRNIVQGVISGMVSSGRTMHDITRNIRYTGKKASDGTMLIDWQETANAMRDFALSANASITELEAYSNALDEQVGVYDTLKRTILTTGEDWDKMDPTELAKQLENAFSGIDGAKMTAVDASGMQRTLEVAQDGLLRFVDNGELYIAQDQFKASIEASVLAIDEQTRSLKQMSVEAHKKLAADRLTEDIKVKNQSSNVTMMSAQRYLDAGKGVPDLLERALSTTIESLNGMDNERLEEAASTTGFLAKEMGTSDGSIVRGYSGVDVYKTGISGSDVQQLLQAIKDAKKTISNQPAGGELDDDVVAAERFMDSIRAMSYAGMATGVKSGNGKLVSRWGDVYAASGLDDEVDALIDALRTEDVSNAVMSLAETLYEADRRVRLVSDSDKNYKDKTPVVSQVTGSTETLRQAMLDLADKTGATDVSMEQVFQYKEAEFADKKARTGKWDLAGNAEYNMLKGAYDYAKGVETGDMSAKLNGVAQYAAGGLQKVGADAIQGTDVGAFVEGAMMGGPIMGLVNMLINALGNLVGGMEVLGYAMNPVSNLMKGLAPLIKTLILPMVLVSRGLEMLGEMLSSGLTWMIDGLFGEGAMESIDKFYDSLTDNADQMEEAARRLEALNEMLDKTRQSIMEAEEYFLVQNRTANAQWAAQMQGQLVMDTRKVNDMILTPHGNFSTAPDDYIIAMKDPASLAASGGVGNVVVKFTVNNNAADVVEAVAEERDDGNGQKEMMVTISRMVAADYASGRNGWDSAYTGREQRLKGRGVSR